MVGFYGIAPLIANYILLLLINPDNIDAIQDPINKEYTFPDEIAERLPSAMRSLSYFFCRIDVYWKSPSI